MSAVYVNNLAINAGADFSQTFILEQFDSSLLDLSNYQVKCQLRKWYGSSSFVEFTASIFSGGRIIISLTSEQTKNIEPGRYLYDILITDPFLVTSRVVEGMAIVSGGVTK